MAFTVPDFNIAVNVYTGPWLTKAFRLTTSGNLAWSRRVGVQGFEVAVPSPVINGYLTLLLPAGTDVRSSALYGVSDVVEAPAGSSRWYAVAFVDDIGKDFPNEHRAALLVQLSHFQDPVNLSGCVWPTPMP